MTDDLKQRAEEMQKRAAAAVEGTTPGPWVFDSENHGTWGENFMVVQEDNMLTDIAEMVGQKGDASFIAASRQLVPEMADLIAALVEENERLRRLGFGMAEVIKACGPGAPRPAQEAAAEFYGHINNVTRAALNELGENRHE